MSFPRYERYKDSGVDWLGEVPEHWAIHRSRRLFAQRKELVRDSDVQLTASQKHGIVTQDYFMQAEGRAVVRVIHGAEILKHVEPNDFVISMRSFQGGLEWSGIRGCISSAYVMLAPSAVVYPGFFRHLFKSDLYIQALQTTSNLVRDGQAMRYENFTLIDLPLPSIDDQRCVARFLDHEVKKIEVLIDEQRRLIELLKEKRQSVISHAVTKGVAPDSPTKDSSVDWIGRIPSHWKIGKFTREVKIAEGQVDPKVEPYSSMLLIGPEHVESRTGRLLNRESAQEQEAESGKYYCVSGDVIYSKIRPALGKVVLAPEDCLCSADMYPFSSRGGVQHQFLYWLLLSDQFISWSVLESDRVAMPKLNRETLSKLTIPVPPLQDQNAIAEHLRSMVARFDTLYSEANDAIGLLQQRRSALISAAVTGKIDVRNYSPKEAA